MLLVSSSSSLAHFSLRSSYLSGLIFLKMQLRDQKSLVIFSGFLNSYLDSFIFLPVAKWRAALISPSLHYQRRLKVLQNKMILTDLPELLISNNDAALFFLLHTFHCAVPDTKSLFLKQSTQAFSDLVEGPFHLHLPSSNNGKRFSLGKG